MRFNFYNKKLFVIFIFFNLIFLLLCCRILIIANNSVFKKKAAAQQFFSLNLMSRRANFYDSNFNSFSCEKKILKAVVFPNVVDFNLLKSLVCDYDEEKLQQMFKNNKPFVVKVKKQISNAQGLFFYFDNERSFDSAAAPIHILGYLNKDSVGMSGLERHYNEFLTNNKFSANMLFPMNGKNKILNFDNFLLKSEGNLKDGIVLTVNKNVQYILNLILQQNVVKGAGVVLNAKTGEIVAISSCPFFKYDDFSYNMHDKNLPLFNRAVQHYALGSIFKIVTAAAALQSNISPNFSHRCDGFFKLHDVKFKCHNKQGHSMLNMSDALKHSCNPFFINLGLKVGAKKLLKTAFSLGFDKKINLCDGFCCKPSTFPNFNMSAGELCNLSFGQGKLKTSILHVAQMLCAFCCDGEIAMPQIVKGKITNSKFVKTFKPIKQKALDSTTAQTLKEMLTNAIVKTPTQSHFCSFGGKSSTAQTGQFKNKKEILNTWFCSFINSKSNPYVVVLLKEDGVLGASDLGHAISLINSYLSL